MIFSPDPLSAWEVLPADVCLHHSLPHSLPHFLEVFAQLSLLGEVLLAQFFHTYPGTTQPLIFLTLFYPSLHP